MVRMFNVVDMKLGMLVDHYRLYNLTMQIIIDESCCTVALMQCDQKVTSTAQTVRNRQINFDVKYISLGGIVLLF